jgi:hypothetical protein
MGIRTGALLRASLLPLGIEELTSMRALLGN